MKKTIIIMMLLVSIITLSACNQEDIENGQTFDREEVSITQHITTGANVNDTNDRFEGGEVQEVTQTFLTNPQSVAIFSFDALDILNYVGIEQTSINLLGVPKSNIPTYLNAFNQNDTKNVGTLFMPDYDALDLFNPDLIIIGGRSAQSYDALKAQYPNTDILDVSLVYGEYIEGLERNVENLGKIFPNIQEALDEELTKIKSEIAAIADVTETYDALFILVNGSTLSFYGSNGRFAVLYDEFGFMPSDEKDDTGQSHGDLVGYEYVAAINPSIIFLMDRGAAIGNAASVDEVTQNALIANTDAGKDGHIYELSGIAWYISSGGFESTYMMISDLENFTEKISN